jgi:ubiquinone/menaquinone biosynthesis C-methylase UbiE
MNLVKKQFNVQAENFNDWPVTKNREYMQRYADFIDLSKTDTVLDVACGTGDFAIFLAGRTARVQGIDISDGMIQIAEKQVRNDHLNNIDFICHDVEHLPCETDSFSVVVCKSAFHHMKNFAGVFTEMIRCCHPRGRLTIQDIAAYDNPKVNDFFERLEKEIDISHHAALSQTDFFQLFEQNNIEIFRSFTVEIELDFNAYLGHAHQSRAQRACIDTLVGEGLGDAEISRYFLTKNDALFFKRKVLLILGR